MLRLPTSIEPNYRYFLSVLNVRTRERERVSEMYLEHTLKSARTAGNQRLTDHGTEKRRLQWTPISDVSLAVVLSLIRLIPITVVNDYRYCRPFSKSDV